MGGAVSSGRDNNELIDNLMTGNYIRSTEVELVFRALDRAEYMSSEVRDQAYRDLAWRNGPLHMSAPCIYSEVMESLELKPGLTFLNVGSGTGYFSTLVGLILGTSGINHGIEVNSFVVDYSNKKLTNFIENSPSLDEFDFCEPKFFCGNGLCLAPLQSAYDRVYCGASCPDEYENYFKQLIKVGGILVMPLNDNLIQVKRITQSQWSTKNLLNVSFASLKIPSDQESTEHIKLDELSPVRLQALSRSAVRSAVRGSLVSRHAELRGSRPPPPPPPRAPERICIPFDDSDAEDLNSLHDLDRESGGNEMNALLNLVLSMGQNRVAGAIRFDSVETPSDSSDEEPQISTREQEAERLARRAERERDDIERRNRRRGRPEMPENENGDDDYPPGQCREILMFQFRGSRPRPVANTAEPSRTSDPTSSDTTTDSNSKNKKNSKISKQKTKKVKKQSKFKKLKLETSNPEPQPGTSKSDTTDKKPQEIKITENPKTDAKSDEESSTKTENQESQLTDPDSLIKDLLGPEMEWEEDSKTLTSDEEVVGMKDSEKKRKKLDSGIGENTPSGSSPEKTDPNTDVSDEHSNSLDNDDIDDFGGRSRRPKRRHRDMRVRSSSSSSSGDELRPPALTSKRRRRALHAACDARRHRLSHLLRRDLHALPLPPTLRHYVNYGREPPT